MEIAIRSKETSSQLIPVRNNYVTIIHQPIILSSNTCTNKAFSTHLQDLIPTLAAVITYSFYTKSVK